MHFCSCSKRPGGVLQYRSCDCDMGLVAGCRLYCWLACCYEPRSACCRVTRQWRPLHRVVIVSCTATVLPEAASCCRLQCKPKVCLATAAVALRTGIGTANSAVGLRSLFHRHSVPTPLHTRDKFTSVGQVCATVKSHASTAQTQQGKLVSTGAFKGLGR